MYALPLAPAAAAAAASSSSSAAEEPVSKRPRPSEEGAAETPAAGGGRPVAGPVIAWVGRTADLQGKFDVAKAKALGIPPGGLLGIDATLTYLHHHISHTHILTHKH